MMDSELGIENLKGAANPGQMRHFFHPEALEEYVGAVSYYAGISRELGGAFVESVEGVVRRHLVRRFPVGIYYCIEDDAIFIYAVMHMSRQPDYWKIRLQEPRTSWWTSPSDSDCYTAVQSP